MIEPREKSINGDYIYSSSWAGVSADHFYVTGMIDNLSGPMMIHVYPQINEDQLASLADESIMRKGRLNREFSNQQMGGRNRRRKLYVKGSLVQ